MSWELRRARSRRRARPTLAQLHVKMGRRGHVTKLMARKESLVHPRS